MSRFYIAILSLALQWSLGYDLHARHEILVSFNLAELTLVDLTKPRGFIPSPDIPQVDDGFCVERHEMASVILIAISSLFPLGRLYLQAGIRQGYTSLIVLLKNLASASSLSLASHVVRLF